MKDRILSFRRLMIVLVHGLMAAGVYYSAFLLRFDGLIPENELDKMLQSLALVVILKLAALAAFQLHHGLWRYVSTHDLVRIVKACVLATLALMAGNVLLLQLTGFPRSIYLLDLCGSILAFSGLRLGLRLFREHRETRIPSGVRRVRTLIVGAGDAGELAVRTLRKGGDRGHEIAGYLDDDPKKQGAIILGSKVLGPISSIPWVVKQKEIDEVLIAMPSAAKRLIKQVVQSCTDTKVRFRILPDISDIVDGSLNVEAIREVQIEDLLGRETVKLDREMVRSALGDKTVLITGAAGSIGSELARQIASYGPKDLILLDVAETPLFHIENELAKAAPEVPRVAVIADVRDPAAMEEVFTRHRPHVVFHAAAYKHVPMMELHPVEAVANNLFGTRNLAEAAHRHGVDNFLMISTDKAVKPRNIMGASKCAAEMLVTALNGNHTRFVAVRFGNVLGSSGSVVPTFRRQIAEGGPVTVTHPEATRLFMTIPEAVELVLQASSNTEAGSVFVLDMGTPVKIVDLATNLIRLSGLIAGEDIDIEYTGLRSGEKLHEELLAYGENLAPTGVEKLSVLRRDDPSLAVPDNFWERIRRLETAVQSRDGQQVIDLLGELVGEIPAADREAEEEPVPYSPVSARQEGTEVGGRVGNQ